MAMRNSGQILYDSPVGKLLITERDEHIVELIFWQGGAFSNNDTTAKTALACAKELDAYFTGQLRQFSVPINAQGTDFRKKVWDALLTIPYGEAISYKELAVIIGQPSAVRAVGGANHNNPISIIIPCHRVIGADGSLTGYGGGLDNKEYLLSLEKRHKQ